MKVTLILVLISFALNAFAFLDYPKNPNPQLTPGSLCDKPTEYRYPEHINYCERNVDTQTKNEVFALYRSKLGYTLDLRNRSNFKIDHFIPLCAGGSNYSNNLWPQHISVFTITDPLESIGCDKLKAGKITQKDLITKIKFAKNNLDKAPQVIRDLANL